MNGRILILIFMFIIFDPPLSGTVYDKDSDIFYNTNIPIGGTGLMPSENTYINNNAIVNINLIASGIVRDDWFTAAFFTGNGPTYSFNGDGQINFFYDGTRIGPDPFMFGLFTYRNSSSRGYLQSNIIFDVNVSLRVADNSNIGRGVFVENGATPGVPEGSFIFNKNLFVDVNNSKIFNSTFTRTIFFTENAAKSNIYVNADQNTKEVVNPNNIIQLKGDIKVGDDTDFYMNLTNSSSFWMGKIYQDPRSISSNFNLRLENGAKWYLTSDGSAKYSTIRNLIISNPSIDSSTRLDPLNEKNFSIVDLFKYDSSTAPGIYCPNDNCPRNFDTFLPRILKIDGMLSGENGIFRLMADIGSRKVDTIKLGTLKGLQYIQIYQNPTKIFLDASGKNMIVASANNVDAGADFKGLATIIGLYDYVPILQRVPNGGGIQWILASFDNVPNQTAKSLANILYVPYQIFRLEGDSAHTRIDDMIYPPTLNGLWAKVYGGGIYAKQPYGAKTTQNLFYNFQGGYDKGEVYDQERYFYGGSLDYTKMNIQDDGFQGHSNSLGMGVYGGYVNEKGWILDANVKYVYSNIYANLIQADHPLDFGNHIFLLSAKVGYNFYPFYHTRTKTIEKCIQKVFCRNDIEKVKVRDESIYIQPYFTLTPGMILGRKNINFEDKQSHSNVSAHLHFSPTLITKLGLALNKRYDYLYSALNLRGLVEYSNDMNLGGNVTLVDDANIPLYIDNKTIDNRLGLGGGVDWMFFNDSLKFHTDFKTEFFGHINTYWLLSAGISYKFGQKAPRTYKSLNLRPMPPKPQKVTPKKYFSPYNERQEAKDKTFYDNNHFKDYGGDKKQIMQKKQKEQQEKQEEQKRRENKITPLKAWESTRPVPRVRE
ncbi:hypothetical protein BKH42_07075 [Helicobacter sp. 13S00482-2]|uniref:autotransporter outer membrane beta-barrel domain-containing protein n=1 Tax=Helicobacter sp. 13S00482-2 TaxID=1476200 RepID=UPI000BA5C8E7|nr:autotransporter outer membrane beta-barrel domain-containing protein [Helicobacter sp. 13S00482-2]PAF53207.1 hypothetical protein BKH42_07075 [Helicobacter sp. 13S00482-2]